MRDDAGRALGHEAARPSRIPLRGWRTIVSRAWGEVQKDHVGLIAAGVAFYGLLALFPAITALVAVAGLMMTVDQITAQLDAASAVLPEGAAEIIRGQATEVAASGGTGLGLAALLGFGFALWSASKGVASLIEGLNIAYDETETRGFVRLKLVTLALTLVLILGVVAGLGATVILPAVLSVVDLGPTTQILISVGRWVVLLALAGLGIAVLFRWGPDRSAPKWVWLAPGAALACVLWLAASALFAVYADNFGSYNRSFGALGGVIALLMWLWISAYVLLMGAEINAEAELQTRHDTTVGRDMPMGARGAVKADTPPPG